MEHGWFDLKQIIILGAVKKNILLLKLFVSQREIKYCCYLDQVTVQQKVVLAGYAAAVSLALNLEKPLTEDCCCITVSYMITLIQHNIWILKRQYSPCNIVLDDYLQQLSEELIPIFLFSLKNIKSKIKLSREHIKV